VFLPQLLLYPNPADPLNGHAASLMNKDKTDYVKRVQAHTQKHAMKEFKLREDDDDDDEAEAGEGSEVEKNNNNKKRQGNSIFMMIIEIKQE